MDANDEKIRAVVCYGVQLCQEGHYVGDKIHTKASNIQERHDANFKQATLLLTKLTDALNIQLRNQVQPGFSSIRFNWMGVCVQLLEAEIQLNSKLVGELQEAAQRLTQQLAIRTCLSSFSMCCCLFS